METEDTPDTLPATARRLIGQYSWQLLGARELVTLAATEAGAPRSACYSAYSRALYAACGAATDPRRQAAAWSDLGRYLHVLAVRLPPPAGDDPADAVQAALLTVHATWARCRQPGGFLAWAGTILRRQAYAAWRATPPTDSLDALLAADPSQEPADRTRTVDPLGDQAVFALLHECLDTDEERLWALCVALGVKRRELGLIFDTPLARFDVVGATVRRKLRRHLAVRALRGRE
ncbi:MAG: hypothetical protein M3Z04_13925 [Chloroflexota bacterium]|nr:hypothetical protein [Chloroflexota bacterium]